MSKRENIDETWKSQAPRTPAMGKTAAGECATLCRVASDYLFTRVSHSSTSSLPPQSFKPYSIRAPSSTLS